MGEGVCYFSWFCSFFSFLEAKGFSLWEKWFPDIWADGSHVLTLPETGSFSVWFLDQQPWWTGWKFNFWGPMLTGWIRISGDGAQKNVSQPVLQVIPRHILLCSAPSQLNGFPSSRICGLQGPSPQPQEKVREPKQACEIDLTKSFPDLMSCDQGLRYQNFPRFSSHPGKCY